MSAITKRKLDEIQERAAKAYIGAASLDHKNNQFAAWARDAVPDLCDALEQAVGLLRVVLDPFASAQEAEEFLRAYDKEDK